MATTLIFLGALIFCAHVFALLFSKRRIPDVMLLITIGIIIGPVLGMVHAEDFGNLSRIFSSLTLIFILLESGVDLSIESIRRNWKGIVQVTIYSFVIAMSVAAVICHFMGFTTKVSIMMGAMVAGTGASIVIPFVRQMRVSEYTKTVLTIESAVSSVVSIVVALSLMDSFSMGGSNIFLMLGKVVLSLLVATAVGMAGGILWSCQLEHLRKVQNSMFLTPAFVFILYGITELIGFSGVIAVLSFGIVLGNTEYFHFPFLAKLKVQHLRPLEEQEKSFFKELVFIFKTYFFVYVGICIPFTNTIALRYGLVITVALFVARYLLLAVVGRENPRNDRRVVSMMIPKGLAAALLASMPEQINQSAGMVVIPAATMVKHVVYAIIFFSIIGTSLLVFFSRKSLVKDTPDLEENDMLTDKKDG